MRFTVGDRVKLTDELVAKNPKLRGGVREGIVETVGQNIEVRHPNAERTYWWKPEDLELIVKAP